MNRILLIVEGEIREKSFFDRYKTVKKMDNVEVVPFRQNIKELYRLCCDFILDDIKPDNIIDILRDSSTNISKEDKEKLTGKFTDTYLIFDLDIQNAKKENKICDYLKELKEIVAFFNDSTTIGQLLINYPMMDSIYHIRDDEFDSYKDIIIEATIEQSKLYKELIDNKKLTFDCFKLNKNDFDMLAAINLKKAHYLIKGDYIKPTANTYSYELSQDIILDRQINCITVDQYMFVLNTSLFIDIDLFGKSLYFHSRGDRLFEDSLLIDSLKKK